MLEDRDNTFSISADVMCQEVGGETVILDLSGSFYFGLDQTGTRIWQLLSEGASVAVTLATLCTEYDVEEARLHADLSDLISSLLDAGLIHRVSPR